MNFKHFLFSLFFLIGLNTQAQIWNSPEAISPIEIGATIPDGSLISQELDSTSLYSILNNDKAVIVIYRGGWCPFCNRQLAELSEVDSQIKALGYRIIAISPEDAVNIENAVDKNDITYEIYSDKNAQLIQDLGLAFYTNKKTDKYISKKSKGTHSGILPVPAVLVVDSDKKINYIYYDVNYKVRLDSDELVELLEKMD